MGKFEWTKKLDKNVFKTALLLVLLSSLAYLPFARQFGFYRDDWYFIWAGHTQTLSTIVEMFSIDRPLVGYLYTRTYLLFGDHPFNWVIFAYFIRLIGSLGFLVLLRVVWPQRKFETWAAAILFAIYPGFLQMPNGATYNNQLITHTLIVLSLLFTVLAIKNSSIWLKAGFLFTALLCQLGYMPLYEYMIGLEGFRFLLIWYLCYRESTAKKATLQAMLWYLPFGLLAAAFVFWRLVIFQSSRPTTDVGLLVGAYRANPFQRLAMALIDLTKDVFEAALLAWFTPLFRLMDRLDVTMFFIGISIAILGCVIVAVFYRWEKLAPDTDPKPDHSDHSMIWIGFLGLLFSLIPVILSGRNIVYVAALDRYTLNTMMPVALLVSGLITTLFRSPWHYRVLQALVLGSLLTQFANGIFFRDSWEVQRQIWWQLSWRAPQIAPETLLSVKAPAVASFTESYMIWAPANIIYAPFPGLPVITGEVLAQDVHEKFQRGSLSSKYLRDVWFPLNFKNALILSMPSEASCLHAIDGYALSTQESETVRLLAEYSHTDRILPQGAFQIPPQIIFGTEPEHTWCYYYQKMALAAQQNDWEAVIRIGEEAQDLGLYPADLSEWLPLLQAYAYTGQFEEAIEILKRIRQNSYQEFLYCEQMLLIEEQEIPVPEGREFLIKELCNASE